MKSRQRVHSFNEELLLAQQALLKKTTRQNESELDEAALPLQVPRLQKGNSSGNLRRSFTRGDATKAQPTARRSFSGEPLSPSQAPPLTSSPSFSGSRLSRENSFNNGGGEMITRLSRENSRISYSDLNVLVRNSSSSSYCDVEGSLKIAQQVVRNEEALAISIKEAGQRMKKNSNQGRSIESIRKYPFNKGIATVSRGPTIVSTNIVLGGRDDANNDAALQALGITHILNVANQLPNYFEDRYVYLHIPLHDTDETSVLAAMPKANDFISAAQEQGGRVLVHCISGVSRSVTVVVMHLMMKQNMPLRDAYGYIKSCRPFIAPNDGFKMQLCELELQVFGCSSVAKNAGKFAADWDFFAWNNLKQTVTIAKSSKTAVGGEGFECCVVS